MLDTFQQNFEIREIPLSLKSSRQKVENFLQTFELRLDEVDYYVGIFALSDDQLFGVGGLNKDVIKCIAISNELQDTGLGMKLISHLYTTALNRGYSSVKVFTKPKNKDIFESLAFHTLAQAEKAILLENGNGLKEYCKYLSSLRREGKNGCIVMNANPFTIGHRYLIEQASKQVNNLYIIVVKENKSLFSYDERKAMIEKGTEDLDNVIVCKGSVYQISSATFPTYFLKTIDDATDTQISLDLDLFIKHIAPSLNISVRFAGTEPKDILTCRYNALMREILTKNSISFAEVPRLEVKDSVVSATSLRDRLLNFDISSACEYAYTTTIPYIISFCAAQSLQKELDTTPKPGLVDKQDNGAHTDMDYSLMCRSIKTLHEYFSKFAVLCFKKDLPPIQDIQQLGIEAENSMMKTTGGVNTHKGALFSMGLFVCATSYLYYNKGIGNIKAEDIREIISFLAKQLPTPNNTHGSEVLNTHKINGALLNAVNAYPELFQYWLPYYKAVKNEDYGVHKTLLYIMTFLDDTNIYYRKGELSVKKVKLQAEELLKDFSVFALEKLNREFVKENISPGGAADMLSLTIFADSILK